jgi:predicted DNA-binding ribbon-helix-helix protein
MSNFEQPCKEKQDRVHAQVGIHRVLELGDDLERRQQMRAVIVKRSIVLGGHKTSVSLEDLFWSDLKGIAHDQKLTLSELVGSIDARRQSGNLSSAIRLFVLDFCRGQCKSIPAYRVDADGRLGGHSALGGGAL